MISWRLPGALSHRICTLHVAAALLPLLLRPPLPSAERHLPPHFRVHDPRRCPHHRPPVHLGLCPALPPSVHSCLRVHLGELIIGPKPVHQSPPNWLRCNVQLFWMFMSWFVFSSGPLVVHASKPLPKFTLACVQHCRPSMFKCLQVHLDGDVRPSIRHLPFSSYLCLSTGRSSGAPELRSYLLPPPSRMRPEDGYRDIDTSRPGLIGHYTQNTTKGNMAQLSHIKYCPS